MMTSIDELIRLYGDELRDMPHPDYAFLARSACGGSPDVEVSIRRAKENLQSRVTNIIRHRVLRHLHSQRTGELQELDTSGLQLF